MIQETASTARHVVGGAHPLTRWIEDGFRDVRVKLRARETRGS
jgi:hypothetical protein